MPITARWNGAVIASSENTVVIEGNHYFPPDDVEAGLLVPSDHTSHCPWKGDAHYYSINVGGEVNENAAWYYAEPKDKAAEIKDRIAFWKGVEVGER